MSIRQQRRIGFSSLILLGLAFVAAVMVSNTLFRGLRIDLTENSLYTISEGTRNVLQGVEEPINLYFFFSDEASGDVPFLRTYATRVREMLEEFENVAGGQLVVHAIEPQPFSEEEDRATQFGIEPVTIDNEPIYFGLAGTNSVGDEAVIPFFQPDKEAFLEYDLASLIYNLSNADRVVVGLLSGVSMTAGFDQRTQRITQPWATMDQVRQLFDVRTLEDSLTAIDEEIDLLWLVHPMMLDQQTLYAIDQFILRGGRALIFVDPLAEIDAAAAASPDAGSASNLATLLSAWGVEFSAGQAVADNVYALSINTGFGQRPVRHLGILGVDQQGMDQEDVVTAGLRTLNFSTAGYFTLTPNDALTFTPLVMSSDEAAALQIDRFAFLPEPETLLDDFTATGDRYVLAARLQGTLQSAFDSPPPEQEAGAAEPGAPAAGEDDAGSADTEPLPHLATGESANVILVGDVDFLSDRMWVQTQSFLGQQLRNAFANNGDFLINALDNLSGSADLIGIRSRATFSREFTVVEALRREADARFRETEQQLQAQLAETERNLSELQATREDQESLLMSEQQQQEIQRFMDQQVQIRRELRAVRRNLDRDIEQLGTTLRVINIGLMPVLLTLVTLIVVAAKRGRRKRAADR